MDEQRVVILPEEIDHSAYKMVLEAALKWPGQEIDLYCRGDGGFIRDAFAIIDVIRQHGNFTGLLTGMAFSSHADIWVACNKRYVYPLGAIGLHQVKIATSEQYKDALYLNKKVQEGRRLDKMIASLFAGASKKSFDDWVGRLCYTGDNVEWIYEKEIIELEMAEPISARSIAINARAKGINVGPVTLVSGGDISPDAFRKIVDGSPSSG